MLYDKFFLIMTINNGHRVGKSDLHVLKCFQVVLNLENA